MAVVSVGVDENEEGVEGWGEWAAAGEVEKGLGGGARLLLAWGLPPYSPY